MSLAQAVRDICQDVACLSSLHAVANHCFTYHIVLSSLTPLRHPAVAAEHRSSWLALLQPPRLRRYLVKIPFGLISGLAWFLLPYLPSSRVGQNVLFGGAASAGLFICFVLASEVVFPSTQALSLRPSSTKPEYVVHGERPLSARRDAVRVISCTILTVLAMVSSVHGVGSPLLLFFGPCAIIMAIFSFFPPGGGGSMTILAPYVIGLNTFAIGLPILSMAGTAYFGDISPSPPRLDDPVRPSPWISDVASSFLSTVPTLFVGSIPILTLHFEHSLHFPPQRSDRSTATHPPMIPPFPKPIYLGCLAACLISFVGARLSQPLLVNEHTRRDGREAFTLLGVIPLVSLATAGMAWWNGRLKAWWEYYYQDIPVFEPNWRIDES